MAYAAARRQSLAFRRDEEDEVGEEPNVLRFDLVDERRSSRRPSVTDQQQLPPGAIDEAPDEVRAPQLLPHRKTVVLDDTERSPALSAGGIPSVGVVSSNKPSTASASGESHTNSRSQQRQLATKRVKATNKLDDQVLGTSASSVVGSSTQDYVRRVDASGRVTLIDWADATSFERVRHIGLHARFGMTGRMVCSMLFVLAVGIVFLVAIFSVITTQYFEDLSDYTVRREAQLYLDCALNFMQKLSVTVPMLASSSNVSSATSVAVDAVCSLASLSAVTLAVPAAPSSRFSSSGDPVDLTAAVQAIEAALLNYNAAFEELSAVSGEFITETDVTNLATACDGVFAALSNALTLSMQLSFTRFDVTRLWDVSVFTGVVARIVAPGIIWASFATSPRINLTANPSPPSQTNYAAPLIGLPTRTAYISAVRRLAFLPRLVTSGFGGVSASTPGGGFDSLTTLLSVGASASSVLNLSVFAGPNTTASSRATQMYSWGTQAAPISESTMSEPSLADAWTTLFVALGGFFIVALSVVYIARQYQNRATRELAKELAQRTALQRAIAAYVPTRFLALMGYDSIRHIRVGDHREVTLTMVFYAVHNYSQLAISTASAERMFGLQQNVMTTAVSVATRHGGFLDKFLGDGAFLLFAEAMSAIVASVELVQESEDLAVRQATRTHSSHRSRTVSRSSSVASHQTSSTRRRQRKSDHFVDVPEVLTEDGHGGGDSVSNKMRGSSRRRSAALSSSSSAKKKKEKDKPESDNDSIELSDKEEEDASDEKKDSPPAESPSAVGSSGDELSLVRSRRGGRPVDAAAAPAAAIAAEDRCVVGIGVHTGTVCVGILGDERRHSCTLISSKVNLASRLCRLTQKLRVSILLSRDVCDACGDHILEEVGQYLRTLGAVQVYGQRSEFEVLELFATDRPEIREYKIATAADWLHGTELRADGHFDEAQSVFKNIRAECSRLVPSRICGVDGAPFTDSPLDLLIRSRLRYHAFAEK